MYRIVEKKYLSSSIVLMKVEAPRLARSAKPGQFLIVRTGELGERIPLTVCDFDADAGTVTIVIQIVGASSRKICNLEQGDSFTDVAGPLGRPSEFMNVEKGQLVGKRFLFIAGGLGFYMSVENAKRTGLIPSALKGKITAVGNTSLAGAISCLSDKENLNSVARAARNCVSYELNESPVFSKEFIENMVFPD